MAHKMKTDLANGVNLIVDRYSFSGITYSMAKGLDKRWVCQPEIGLPKPDLVLFFDVEPDDVKNREGFGEEALEKSEFQRLVYAHMKCIFDATYWKVSGL